MAQQSIGLWVVAYADGAARPDNRRRHLTPSKLSRASLIDNGGADYDKKVLGALGGGIHRDLRATPGKLDAKVQRSCMILGMVLVSGLSSVYESDCLRKWSEWDELLIEYYSKPDGSKPLDTYNLKIEETRQRVRAELLQNRRVNSSDK